MNQLRGAIYMFLVSFFSLLQAWNFSSVRSFLLKFDVLRPSPPRPTDGFSSTQTTFTVPITLGSLYLGVLGYRAGGQVVPKVRLDGHRSTSMDGLRSDMDDNGALHRPPTLASYATRLRPLHHPLLLSPVAAYQVDDNDGYQLKTAQSSPKYGCGVRGSVRGSCHTDPTFTGEVIALSAYPLGDLQLPTSKSSAYPHTPSRAKDGKLELYAAEHQRHLC
ncbi:hypothetical protein EDD85DRAFT_961425 [Armillaria nabsnona]|nr:hypothetical protein EDD85DRAFT_961425 [Armillaria nabsnona]